MDRFDTARALVLAAGARLRLARPKAGAVWEKTGHQDLVTRCDRETEQFLRSGILSAFPGDAIVGEEYPATPPGGTGCVWYLDPIDGT
ncbi:MAG: inositol monophosphatase, partial [Clostridiales bacterium]|nr:inositol monophosphatase [Clostridiales bacterium]